MVTWPTGEDISVEATLERLRDNPHFDLRRMAEVDTVQLLASLADADVVIAFDPDGDWSFPKGKEKIDAGEAGSLGPNPALAFVSVRVANALQANLLYNAVQLIKKGKMDRRRAPRVARLLAWAAKDPDSMQNDMDRHAGASSPRG
jgi:hypothetical protein